MPSASAPSRRHELVFTTVLILFSVLFSLFVLEFALRAWRGPEWLLKFPNLIREERVSTRNNSDNRAQYDSVLGFIGIPNYRSPKFNYDEHAFRITPAPPGVTLKEPPILAVGGSVTLGFGLADDETFPSQLQSMIGRRVINAGMDGYGLDQMILRAEVVVPQVKPAAIVVGTGLENLKRNEMSRVFGVEKPYFELVDGKLVLRNEPVPPTPDPATTLDFWQRLLGRSLLVDELLSRLHMRYDWYVDHVYTLPAGEGIAEACPLFKRLAALKLPTIVVAEYQPYLWYEPAVMRTDKAATAEMLRCAQQAGLATVDPFDEIDRTMRTAGHDALFAKVEHPNAAGQALTARLVAEKLRQLNLP